MLPRNQSSTATKYLRGILQTLRSLILGLALFLTSAGVLQAQSASYTLNQHKALYLFNFAKYTEWPKESFASDTSPFILGILGDDPFHSALDIIKGKTLKGRKLEVRYCHSPQQASGCQMLFICGSETNKLEQIMRALEPQSILLVAETDGFLERRGMINLVTEQKNPGVQVVGFEINQAAAEKAKLKLDTQLLKLARRTKSNQS